MKASLSTPRHMALLSIATSCLTLGLKFSAYAMTGAVSLLSDALEAFVNLAAGLVAWGAITIAARPADRGHSYGHDKAEYFASGVEGVLILVAAASIAYAAIPRLLTPAPLTHLGPGLLVALLAAGANFVTARIMFQVAQRHESIAIEADAKHLMTDVWTSLAVVAGLLVVLFAPQWHRLDPILAIAVAVHIIYTGIDLLRRSTQGLMDASLPPDEVARIEALLERRLPPHASYDGLRTRRAGMRRFIEFSLRVPGSTLVRDAHDVCDELEQAIGAELARAAVTIHVEPSDSAAGPRPLKAGSIE